MKTNWRRTMAAWVTLVVIGLGGDVGSAASGPTRTGTETHYVIGLSPSLDREVRDEVFRSLVGFILQDVPLNSSVGIYDAYHLKTIAELEIPDLSAFRGVKTRANQFKGAIAALRTFLARGVEISDDSSLNGEAVNSGGAGGSGVDNGESGRAPGLPTGSIRFPQFMDFITENRHAEPMVVLIIGSPLYFDAKEPGFSMSDGYFPSDGHLTVGRDQSVYGIKDRSGALTGSVVHWAYFGDPWVTEVHREKVSRFWHLFVQGQGGRLAAFCGDLPTMFHSATRRAEAGAMPVSDLVDPAHGKVEMLRVRREVGSSDWITRDDLPEGRPSPPTRRVGLMKIGIRWKGDWDLDLYASPAEGAETLFFQHPRSREGYYFKDYRSSPNGDYEYVEFQRPVDGRQVEAMVNFYEGESRGGVSGEVRIEFDGTIYSERFTLPAEHGNRGRSGPGEEAFWTRIDLKRILSMESPQP